MPDDLPEVSPDLNAPLPTVDPNSQLVPYRMSRTDPGGQPVVTTGYGPRARPIQPPDSFNLDRIANAAFSQLPVDEASKAVEAASRYLGQRGYQKDLQSGMNPAQAFAKWAPMMFRTATGIPEAIDRSVPPPITPQQMVQNQQRAATEKRLRDEMVFRQTHVTPDAQARIDAQRERDAAKAQEKASNPKPLAVENKQELSDAYKALDKARNDMSKLSDKDITDKAVQDAMGRMDEARRRIAAFNIPNPAQPQPHSPFKEGQIVKNKKDGKRYKIVNGQPVPLKE